MKIFMGVLRVFHFFEAWIIVVLVGFRDCLRIGTAYCIWIIKYCGHIIKFLWLVV